MIFLVLFAESNSAASLLWENEVKKKKCTCREDNGETRAHGDLFPGPQIIGQSHLSITHLITPPWSSLFFFHLYLVIFTRRWALNPPEDEDDS